MKKSRIKIDWKLIIPVILIVLMSLSVLFSLNPLYFRNQLITVLFSLLIFLFISQISYKDYRDLTLPLYVLSLILLIMVYMFGFESRGAVRWVDIFGVSLQASEIVKPISSLIFSSILARNLKKSIKVYLMALSFILPIFILVYLQPDLGSALVFAGVFMTALVIYGIPFSWLFVSSLPLIFASPLIFNNLLDYQKVRILTFLNPMLDPRGSSYNLIQAIIAVGSGGAFGKGIAEGTQSRLKFLPENHTDFIFASLSEKFGFLGSTVLIILFVFLLYRIYRIYTKCPDTYGKVFCICAFLFILIQFFTNIAMNLGLVPVVGITLPFVSYGGSSILSNFIFLGILSSISVRSENKGVLEIK